MEIQKERTLVVIKPDGIQRSLIGEVIKRIERTGLKLVALKFSVPKEEKIRKHYLLEDNWLEKVGQKTIDSYNKKGKIPPSQNAIENGERILENLINYMTSGPVVSMVWQGAHAVSIVRKLVGSTEPLSSDVGTIRGDYVIDSYELSDIDGRSIRNVLHASSSVEEAKKEVDLWFKSEEIINYRLVQEQILYDVNLDGILE
ncbi:MAG TPA: nucleoside-diphosphate kinase [Candidatus Paceibacterota bacterium]|nr:nucleoside-diphosphate kinase [Candidatus Paceibacterota bacterium]HMP19131.1 nucleoside-diphosphate kinase [Candidatus Paceibacterota bacterium]HMP85160.1 nucleoside-diphosphate kinase [Candidatus Paceibacterota bacterium]